MRMLIYAVMVAMTQWSCGGGKRPGQDPKPLVPSDTDPAGDGDGGDAPPGDSDDGDGDGDNDAPTDVDPCANRETRVPNQEPEWLHVSEDGAAGGVIVYDHNPPASGPHYFTWARYMKHDQPVPKPNYVHNLEHGAIVMLYHPDAPAEVRDALEQAWEEIPVFEPSGTKMLVMSPAPDLPYDFAIVAWHYVFTNACQANVADIVDFAVRRRGQGREADKYGDGAWPMKAPCNRWLNARDNQWTYVIEEGTSAEYLHSPPTSGPHYERSARYQEHATEVPPEYWVGNLERGGIVMLYHPDADPTEIAKFRAAYAAVPNHWPCPHKMTLLAPSRDVPLETPFYVLSWDAFMRAACVDEPWAFMGYANEMRFGRDASSCDDGTFPE